MQSCMLVNKLEELSDRVAFRGVLAEKVWKLEMSVGSSYRYQKEVVVEDRGCLVHTDYSRSI